MATFKDKTVLITGGTSGIGRIMAIMAAERGAKQVIVWGTSIKKIEDIEAQAKQMDYNIKGFSVDVSNNEAVISAYAALKEEFGTPDILINNAGIVTGNSTFDNHTIADIERTMNINAKAPMVVALQALPDMIARDSGHICNIGSAAGMIANPKMSVYVASKWAILGWSDSVRIELEQMNSNVHITTVAPYYINTGMFNGVRSRFLPILDPHKTARKIIRAIEKNKSFIGIPLGFHLIRFVQGILPRRLFDIILGKWGGIYNTMDNFTGRK